MEQEIQLEKRQQGEVERDRVQTGMTTSDSLSFTCLHVPNLQFLLLLLLLPFTAVLAKHRGVWRHVEAVAGREAVLPCEVGSLDASDMVFVVLWYKNGDKEPMYSYDNRPGRLAGLHQRHTLKNGLLEGRATFRPGQVPALHIRPVLAADQANYTCRVDFRIASSRRTYLSLWVVEPPEIPVVTVAGRHVAGGVLGPLQEGDALALTCTVAGGVPPPSVTWIRDGQVVDEDVESRNGGFTVNELRLAALSRDYHNSQLACVADNNNVTSPPITSLTLVMSLRPIVTSLEHPPRSLRMGREYHILCVTAGSRPHPNITWTLGNVAALSPLVAETHHGANVSSSRVTLFASRRHHGQRLSCTALNPLFPDHPLTDSLLLNVTYPPVASLELRGRSASVVVREEENVTFTCNVDANPPSYKTSWYLADRPIAEGSNVEVSVNSLVLSRVTRHQAGPYTCSASNVEGDARSTPLSLTVNYVPVCEEPPSGETRKVYVAGVGRPVNITCEVLASPPSVRFSWVFNNSVASERLPGDQVFSTSDRRSVAQFRPKMHQDFGTLQCWAQNSVGRMMQPCLFQVLPAGRPERPVSCAVVNKTYESLVVACDAGFDGGLMQSFSARVFESVTGIGQVNVTSDLPTFTLEGLTPGLDYVVKVEAHNELGASPPTMLEAFTYKTAENRMRNEKVEEVTSSETEENRPGVGVSGLVTQAVLVAGAASAVVLLLAMVTVVVRCVADRSGHHHHHRDVTSTNTATTSSAATTTAMSAASAASFALSPETHMTTAGGQCGAPHTEISLELSDLLMVGPCTPPEPPLPPVPPPHCTRK